LTAFTLRWNYSPLKEKVTLLPGGLFVCGKDTGSQNITIQASSLILFQARIAVFAQPFPPNSCGIGLPTHLQFRCSGQLCWIASLKENRRCA
jgi:hypothetical protein